MNAYVTVNADGVLTDTSVAVVEDADGIVVAYVRVPSGCPWHGLILFWHRVSEPLHAAGWALDRVGPDSGWVCDGDVVRFNAKRLG